MKRICLPLAVAAMLAIVSAAQTGGGGGTNTGGGNGTAVQFVTLSGIGGSCTASQVGYFSGAYYGCPAGTWVALGSGGGGGVTTFQFDTASPLSGAVQVLSGAGLSSACSSGGTASPCTFTVNQATTSTFGGVLLGLDLAGAYNAQQVVGLHFGTNAVTLSGTAPTVNAPLCVSSGNVVQTASCSSGGSSSWSGLTNPSAALALTMGANTTTFTYNAPTGPTNLFNITDAASDADTGFLFNIGLGASSNAAPMQACGAFGCLQVTNTGLVKSTNILQGDGDVRAGTGPQWAVSGSSGDVLTYNDESTTGIGQPYIIGSSVKTAQTSSTGTVALVASTSSASLVQIQVSLNCDGSASGAIVTANASYTDPSSTVQTVAVGSGVTCTTLGTASVATLVTSVAVKTGTAINYSATVTAGSPTYDVRAVVLKETAN